MRRIEISNLRSNKTVTGYIKDYYPNLSSSALYKALRNKDIRINDKRISDDVVINNGDVITIYIDDKILFGLPKTLNIIYEDDNILIVFKPQGILSNNEDSFKNLEEPTFEDFVKTLCTNTRICHRLDRNTSGLVIFSKNDIAYNEILNAFKNGNINKEYIAYVYGTKFNKEHELFEKYIIKNPKDGLSKVIDQNVPSSKKIITEITVIKKDLAKEYSILKVNIHTGKTHQIRAQLSAISHPIIGDSKYGKNEINKKFRVYKQLLFASRYTFQFENDSPLSYLNSKSFRLSEEVYTNKL